MPEAQFSDQALELIKARQSLHKEGYATPRASINVTLSIPKEAQYVAYYGQCAESGGPWTSPDALGWCWWTGTSDEIVGPDRRITYSFYNESGDRTRRVRVTADYS